VSALSDDRPLSEAHASERGAHLSAAFARTRGAGRAMAKGKKGKKSDKGKDKPVAPTLKPGHFFTGSSLLAVWP
jgi:hypothetical protein